MGVEKPAASIAITFRLATRQSLAQFSTERGVSPKATRHLRQYTACASRI